MGPQRRHGTWRLLCSAATVLLSALLMTILLGGLAAWTVPAVAVWAAAGWVLLLRPVERVAVRVVLGFRAAAGLDAAWLRAGTEQRSGVPANSFDWYVYADPQPTRSRPRWPSGVARSRSRLAFCSSPAAEG
ncbi:MAG: hypothetical protein ACR2JU_03055 [Nocardioidaceae bacterium]